MFIESTLKKLAKRQLSLAVFVLATS